ncbi:transposase [Nonomuraea sp. NPDC048901]|uniref:transposase n=1 Tax=Nonomuraea sp. NPDC048901 TaxID=3155627 RepID=UPI0033CB14BF
MVWRFRTGSPWRDVPDRYGSWSTVYNLFRLWVTASTFQALMDEMIAEAAAREQVDLSLVSVDSTVARAQHAAGMVVDSELQQALEQAVAEEKGIHQRGKTGREQRSRTPVRRCGEERRRQALHTHRNTVERCISKIKQWRGIAPATTRLPRATSLASTSAAPCCDSATFNPPLRELGTGPSGSRRTAASATAAPGRVRRRCSRRGRR